DKLEEIFIPIFNLIRNAHTNLTLSRFGLRYINTIVLKGVNFFDWRGYIDNKLLSILKLTSKQEYITRAFNLIELQYPNFAMKFQYGMHNPDYPASIKKKVFVLDYDAYHNGQISLNDVKDKLSEFHKAINKKFENSINAKLRAKLNE
ncbi:TIGR04255 family protein, partial [Thermodesulfobacteriota bacterium]